MNRVYVHDGKTWTLAARYALKGPLPREADEYVVLETPQPPSAQQVCTLLDDGRRLCDIGPQHEHDPEPLADDGYIFDGSVESSW